MMARVSSAFESCPVAEFDLRSACEEGVDAGGVGSVE